MQGTNGEEIYRRLKSRRSLKRLGLEERDGRLVIQGMRVPQPVEGKRLDVPGYDVVQMRNTQHLHFRYWKNLHFIDCDLSEIAFFTGSFTNCIFENCKMRGIGFWGFRMKDCRFFKCDLRDAVFGGDNIIRKSKGCRYENVVWERCDLRVNGGDSESYHGCKFLNNRMEKVHSSAVYENCVFEGRFYEIQFDTRRLLGRQSSNKFKGCDFRKADSSSANSLDSPSIRPCFRMIPITFGSGAATKTMSSGWRSGIP